MSESVIGRALELKGDHRGWLLKVLMRHHIEGPREFGEIYVTMAHPGQVRGNHYHNSATEWFCVVQGVGKLVTEDLATGVREEYILDAAAPHTVQVNPNVAHAIQNVGTEPMLLLAYADEPYDAAQPDEVRRIVVAPPA